MGFRFYRRINLGSGLGLNLSKSGIGTSVRGKHGSIGSSGFSIRTGIPGLSYRQGWGKGGQGALVFIAVAAFFTVAAVLAVVAFKVLVVLLTLAWQCAQWCFLTARDYIEYRKTGKQPIAALRAEPVSSVPAIEQQSEKTLAQIMEEAKTQHLDR